MSKPSVSLLREIYEKMYLGNEWIDKVPSEISGSYFDNPYVNSLNDVNDILLKAAFGDCWEAADWFLNEWQPGFECGINGNYFNINTPEEYYEHLIEYEGWVK